MITRNVRKFNKNRHDTVRAYAVITPFYLLFTIWAVFPIIFIIILAFFSWNGLDQSPVWVGLRNFEFFFKTPDYTSATFRQLWIGGLCLITNTVFAFIIGLLLNYPSKLSGFFRTSVYVPVISSTAATTAVVVALLNPFSGGLNKFLSLIGKDPVVWSYSAFWMTFWIIVYFVWKNVGVAAIMVLGGIQSISPQLYEAAKIDGANPFQEIRYITLPGLSFVAKFIIITGIIGVLQIWDIPLFISGGGPINATETLALRVWRDCVKSFNFGMSGAGSVVLIILTLIFSYIYLRISEAGEENENT